LIADTRPDIILVAITSANAELLQDLDTICTETGTRLQVIPTASQLVKDQLSLGDITDVTDEELMGRRSYVTDETSIRKMIMNMTVLVTGAGGSIGSELATQLAGYQPKRLLLLDRDESALHSVQLRLDGTGNLASSNLLLVDIRDGATIFELFQSMKPDIVFHAAALKHLPLLERFPHEAWKTNVVGTSNVLRAALDSGTEIFVNVSTDKAAEPASTLGHSKLITERMTAGVSPDASRRFMSVRFGNVLGSRGSVIATFQHQIRQGGPVTITHPEITRYLMTTREAVNLVLQAAVVGRPGETLVLDMGRPVRILDVARKLISKAGKDVDIVYTGLRKGEKLHEKLIADSEKSLQQVHPSISHICVDPLPLDYTENAFQADLAEQTSWSHEPRRQISSHDGLHS
jgi:dTDP-glucose 4,6-dehydratase